MSELSREQGDPDPWKTVTQRYKVGQIVDGVVTKVVSFGAFVRIEGGVEGLLHSSQLPEKASGEAVYEGQRVRPRILYLDKERRRLSLSLRGVSQVVGTSETLCPACGRTISPDWKHCTYCGTTLAKVCPNCGAPRPDIEGVRFCFECGSQLE